MERFDRRQFLKIMGGVPLSMIASSERKAPESPIESSFLRSENLNTPIDRFVIAAHGWTGHGKAGWLEPLQYELSERNIPYAFPDLGDEERPNVDNWIAKIQECMRNATAPLIMVGYSLGSRAILRAINQIPEEEHTNIDTLILVAPFAIDRDFDNSLRRDGKYANFFQGEPINADRIIKRIPKRIVLASESDPQIFYDQHIQAASALNAHLISYIDRGHFVDTSDNSLVLTVLLLSQRSD